MSTKIIWEEPPAQKRGRPASSRLEEVLTQLRANPGRWAKVNETKSKGGQASYWRKHGCEATTRRDQQRDITATYARWPEDKATPAPKPAPEPQPQPQPEPEPAPGVATVAPGPGVATVAPGPGVATVRPLATAMTKGTCQTCGAKNRGLTNGVCRMCTIRAREAAAREAS